MSFVSLYFLAFLAVVFIVYFTVPKRGQWIVLLAASYVFYLFSGAGAVFFILFTTIITFFTGVFIGKVNDQQASAFADGKGILTQAEKKQIKGAMTKKKKMILAAALLAIFCVLFFLKYFGTIAGFLNLFSEGNEIKILLPLGISFYTFQSAGYIIDVYRGKYAPDKNFAKFALFVSFFPQIVQGPISRYDQLAHQLFEPHSFHYREFKFGAQRALWGFFKKMVIADRAAILVNQVVGNYQNYAGFQTGIAMLFYTIQIYADFSGGMDISIGITQSMGMKMTENFRRPYFATSIQDYWRRWHITLGAWMKDYVFYPISISKAFSKLGKFTRKMFGNHLGKLLPTCLAMLIVFFLVGEWHGASLKYVAYGLYNGVLIILGILLTPLLKNANEKKFHIKTERFRFRLLLTLGTFILIWIGKYFAPAPSLTAALKMLQSTFSTFNSAVLFDGSLFDLGLDRSNFILFWIAVAVLFIVSVLQEKGYKIRDAIEKKHIVFRWTIYFTAIFTILIFGVYGSAYNAGDFIYMKF